MLRFSFWRTVKLRFLSDFQSIYTFLVILRRFQPDNIDENFGLEKISICLKTFFHVIFLDIFHHAHLSCAFWKIIRILNVH